MDIINLIVYLAYSVIVAALVVIIIRIALINRKLTSSGIQLSFDKIELLKRIQALSEEKDSVSVEKTDGFLKFVSESRDWAFDYIEDVQQALRAYDIALSTDDARLMNEAYSKLISLLPDDDVVN